MLKKLTGIVALVMLGVTITAAQEKTKDVVGTWDMNLMSHQVALVLEQDGSKVTGTFSAMGKDMPVFGEFADNQLSLTGKGALMGAPSHDGGPAPEPVPMRLTGTLLEDGTLAGEMPSPMGVVKWTAERLKKKK